MNRYLLIFGRITPFVALPANVCSRRTAAARRQAEICSAAIWVRSRIASPEMFPEAEMLPHLICSRPIFIGGANDEADQYGGA